jgi:ketosteroid isomerase-like protein
MKPVCNTATIILLFSFCCNAAIAQLSAKEKAIAAIVQAEKDFAAMAAAEGIEKAFWFFADEKAIIKRQNDSLISGKDAIRLYYAAPYFKRATVEWAPDFADASESGDMGYTYGSYIWREKKSDGTTTEARGIFHTVWKKQQDGSWKFVWD